MVFSFVYYVLLVVFALIVWPFKRTVMYWLGYWPKPKWLPKFMEKRR